MKLTDGHADTGRTTDGLADEIRRLVVMARNNRNELVSYVESSTASFQMTSDQQVMGYVYVYGKL